MQKKIIALAIAGLASTAAFAQSNVTVYGVLDAGFVTYSGTRQNNGVDVIGTSGNAPRISKIDGSQNSSSRLGFKGEENLGGGAKAMFTAEFGLNADGGAASQGTGTTGLEGGARVMTVGMQTNMGTFKLGRDYTPFFVTVKTLDPFGATGVAATNTIHPVGLTAITRSSSSMQYSTPAFGPFSANIMMGMGERTANGVADTKTLSWNALYIQGPVIAGVTYINLNDYLGVGNDLKSTAFGGSYDLGMVRLVAANNRYKNTNKTAFDHSDWLFGAVMPMGAHTFKAAFNKANDKLAANADATHFGLGYQYDLSKRTAMYAQYGKVSNKNGAAFAPTNLAATWGAGGATARTTGLALGLQHSF
jgi:GBP family porin